MAGAGTVVTGTLWGAPLSPGDRVRVLPTGALARVRSIQAHDRPVERATGGRVALAPAGVSRELAPRGACVVADADDWEPTERLDVALIWLEGAGGPLRTRRRLQAFIGSAEISATCVLLDAECLVPGASGPVQLRLERPVAARPGDRVVLRSAERRTVGGGPVVDAHPPRRGRGRAARAPADAGLRPPSRAEMAGRLGETERACAGALARLREGGAAVQAGGLWFDAAAVGAARESAVAALASQAMSIGALRDLWGVGRRHALAIAEHLDVTGVTRRQGDLRILRRGARAP